MAFRVLRRQIPPVRKTIQKVAIGKGQKLAHTANREWATRLRLVMLENDTVESIQALGASQPKITVRGLCQRCNRARPAVFSAPRCMCELRFRPSLPDAVQYEHASARKRQISSIRSKYVRAMTEALVPSHRHPSVVRARAYITWGSSSCPLSL